MKKIATLILNRNLPEVSNKLVEHIQKWSGDITDIFVIESGSDEDKLSKYCKFWANWPEAKEKGLHYCRGFNYGLMELDKEKIYEYYFMVCGDSVFYDEPTLNILLEKMEKYPKFGIISPLSPYWGETAIFSGEEDTKCLWVVPHVAWLIRRSFLDKIIEKKNSSIMNYFYDGTNFRGYDADTELGIKAYLNDFALAVTSRAKFHEEQDLTDKNAQVMKTEKAKEHLKLMFEEGLAWMKRKYGFNSKSEMRDWAKRVYDEFFKKNPDYRVFKYKPKRFSGISLIWKKLWKK